MNAELYLKRMNCAGPLRPDDETLRRLHRAHVLTVPFENLDILPLHRPIALDEAALWQKIVVSRRGGFCYELNGLFASLLREIGYQVTFLNARVFGKSGQLGSDFDHLALLVRGPGEPIRWLVDVGFGDSFTEPLRFDERGDQEQHLRAYRLELAEAGCILWQRDYTGQWSRLYFFDLRPRNFPGDYEAACRYHQSSPKSSFTRGSMISRATPDGRISLQDGWLIVTTDGIRKKRPLNDGDFPVLLNEHFGVVLPE